MSFIDCYSTLYLCVKDTYPEDMNEILLMWWYEFSVPYPFYKTQIRDCYVKTWMYEVEFLDPREELVFDSFYIPNLSYHHPGLLNFKIKTDYVNGILLYKPDVITCTYGDAYIRTLKDKNRKNLPVTPFTVDEMITHFKLSKNWLHLTFAELEVFLKCFFISSKIGLIDLNEIGKVPYIYFYYRRKHQQEKLTASLK